MRLVGAFRGFATGLAMCDSALAGRGKLIHERRSVALVPSVVAACMMFGGVLLTVHAARCADATLSFLVATPDMPDPVFEQTVILMLPPGQDPLVAGIIVNKPTTIKLEQLFPHAAVQKNQGGTAYFGGPVDLDGPSLFLRTAQAPAKAMRLFDNVYVSTDTGSIAGILGHAQPARDVRLFFGRAQWTPEQLHDEMLEGAWYVVRAKPDLIFSSDPASVWRMLVERAQVREVDARPGHGPNACAFDRPNGRFARPLESERFGYKSIALFAGDDVYTEIDQGVCQRRPVESALR